MYVHINVIVRNSYSITVKKYIINIITIIMFDYRGVKDITKGEKIHIILTMRDRD